MKTIVALAALLIPIMSFAHPGHGSTDGFNLTHYFIESEHAVFTWTFVLIGVCLVSMYGVKKRNTDRSNPV